MRTDQTTAAAWVTGNRTRALVLAVIALPYAFVTIPPLTDVPGHMGRAAIAAQAALDPRFRQLFEFRWYPVPNLGADLIVEALRHVMSITSAYWLVATAIPLLLTLGLFAVVHRLNPRGSATLPFALLFVWSFPYNYGFLNYMLAVALSLLGFAAWLRLDARPHLREALTWLGVPLVFLCHAVGGSVLSLLIASREVTRLGRWDRAGLVALLHRLRPLIVGALIIVAWRLSAVSVTGVNDIGLRQKLNALVMMLRDQHIVLDVGSLVACLAVFLLGRARGARIHRAAVPALAFLLVLFTVMPSRLSGSHFADMRIIPLVPLLALALQDWRSVAPRLAHRVALAGFALLGVRLATTTLGFIAYERDYREQLAALTLIPAYSRVIVLRESRCNAFEHWRQDRRGHLGELLQVYRRSWSNGQWDTDGGHLIHIATRPSPAFYHDPSQAYWAPRCVKPGVPDRQTLAQALTALPPRDRFDFLWVIGATLQPVPLGLQPVWSGYGSSLYRAGPTAPTG